MADLTVVIYNTHLYDGTLVALAPNQVYEDNRRQAALIEKLLKEKPEIIGLSEVWASSHENQIIRGTQAGGYSAYAYQDSPITKLNPGLTLLSSGQLQKPMSFRPYEMLVGWDSYAEKGVVYGEVLIADKSIYLVQTHTQATYAGSETQDEEARKTGIYNTLFPILDSILNASTGPVLLLGDLNIVADSAEYHEFQRQMFSRGMKDIWSELYPLEPGYTYDPTANALIRRFAPEDTQKQRLDYVFFRDNGTIKPKSASVLQWKDASGIDISDHYGLEAVFTI